MNSRAAIVLLRYGLACAITAVVFWLLFQYAEGADSKEPIRTANMWLLVAAAAVITATSTLRAVRLSVALGERPSWLFMRISFLHNFATSLAPLRLGEAALPYLLKRHQISGFWAGTGVLIVIRIIELAVIMTFGGIALAAVDFIKPAPTWIDGAGVAIGGLSLLGLVLIPLALRRMAGTKPVGTRTESAIWRRLDAFLHDSRNQLLKLKYWRVTVTTILLHGLLFLCPSPL
jgi:hypothetical protein